MALSCSGGYKSFDQTIWNSSRNMTVQSDKRQTRYAAKSQLQVSYEVLTRLALRSGPRSKGAIYWVHLEQDNVSARRLQCQNRHSELPLQTHCTKHGNSML